MRRFSSRRSAIVRDLAEAYWHLAESGLTDRPTMALLEHALRDALSDVDCPACCEAEFAKQLDKAVEAA